MLHLLPSHIRLLTAPIQGPIPESDIQGIQAIMLPSTWPVTIREAEKVGFVDRIQYLDNNVMPHLFIDSRRGLLLQCKGTIPECVQIVDVVKQRGESQRPILLRCLTYPLKRTLHGCPALCDSFIHTNLPVYPGVQETLK